jgi:purine-binding chemotaxis protein CheW
VTSRREHRSVRYRIADDRVLDLVAAAQGVVSDRHAPAETDGAPVVPDEPPAPAPAPVAATPGLHVVFELGGEECALPVEHVREVMRHETPRRVPSTLPGLLGVRDVRGSLLGVHDLAAVLGHPAADPESLLVVHDRLGRAAGLAAGPVRGVEAVPAEALRRPGTRVPGVAAIAVGARGLLLVLDADALLAVLRGGGGAEP